MPFPESLSSRRRSGLRPSMAGATARRMGRLPFVEPERSSPFELAGVGPTPKFLPVRRLPFQNVRSITDVTTSSDEVLTITAKDFGEL